MLKINDKVESFINSIVVDILHKNKINYRYSSVTAGCIQIDIMLRRADSEFDINLIFFKKDEQFDGIVDVYLHRVKTFQVDLNEADEQSNLNLILDLLVYKFSNSKGVALCPTT